MRKVVIGVGAALVVLVGALVFVVAPSGDGGGKAVDSKDLNALSPTVVSGTPVARLFVGAEQVAYVQEVSGGDVVGEVVDEAPVGSKRIRSTRTTPLKVGIELHTNRTLVGLLDRALRGNTLRQVPFDGSIIEGQPGQRGRQIAFTKGLIYEIGFPRLDTTDRSKAGVSLLIAFATVKVTEVTVPADRWAATPQPALALNAFSASVTGIDLTRTVEVSGLGMESEEPIVPPGSPPGTAPVPGPVDALTPTLTLPLGTDASVRLWADDFLVKGHNLPTDERAGSVSFLAGDLRTPLLTIVLQRCGIRSHALTPLEAGEESSRRSVASLYCEQLGVKTP